MVETDNSLHFGNAISESWERCELKYKLVRDAARPILRLQSSEVAPRLEELVERSGGRQGIISQLAQLAANAGHCLVVTDTEGVSVRLEGTEQGRSIFEENGIAIGSCWDERIAGTNGVSMALSERDAFTVSGRNHYFSSLHPFACTAAPLFNAENQTLGAISLAMLDRNNSADYLFASQLLGTAADRIQRILFEKRFADSLIISVSSVNGRDLLKRDELVALNEAGIILGTTAGAHRLVGDKTPAALKGKAFELVFGTDAKAMESVPERVMSVRSKEGPVLNFSARPNRGKRTSPASGRSLKAVASQKPKRIRLAASLRQLSIGSDRMAALCTRALAHYRKGLPFLIEGESGTGKTALIAAILEADKSNSGRITKVDCASLGETEQDKLYFQTLLEQARIAGSFGVADQEQIVLVFENVDELPKFAQARLRMLMGEIEANGLLLAEQNSEQTPKIIATCRQPLHIAVQDGKFRDDLYFLLANTIVQLPPLRQRERVEALAGEIARQLAGEAVQITEEAKCMISCSDWPGNVRELKNALQQALMEGDGRRISRLDLPERTIPLSEKHRAIETRQSYSDQSYDERTLIQDALIGARWNVSRAARNIGMGRATIHRKMKQYGIARPR
ncbi:sigma-54-dependent Fis family transcriptional regulator [Ruegeria arenilitoris]|uniref:sigma-54-dependent Fis family transcriptional regulator n=1 Tax=Ruegeria arenilitoris TaxID=1173585 RepID=UPI00147F8AD0|nr:sigma 54-interacting transcriptional regulator [Ruegeria arenilitoris]